jgi:hypothetical protein
MAERDQKQSDLAGAMWPHLSQPAKAERARQARMESERRERSKRLADNLQATIDAVRRLAVSNSTKAKE